MPNSFMASVSAVVAAILSVVGLTQIATATGNGGTCYSRAVNPNGTGWVVGCQGSCSTPPCQLLTIGVVIDPDAPGQPVTHLLKNCGCPNQTPTWDSIVVPINGSPVTVPFCDVVSVWTNPEPPMNPVYVSHSCAGGCGAGSCQVDDPQSPNSVRCVCK